MMKVKAGRIKPAPTDSHAEGVYALRSGASGRGPILATATYPIWSWDMKEAAVRKLRDHGKALGLTAIYFGNDNLLEGE